MRAAGWLCAATLLAGGALAALETSRAEPVRARQAPPAPATPPASSASAPRLGSVQAQWEAAVAAKQALRGKLGREREPLLEAAIEAYRAVRRYWPQERALAAEAAFRAGELLRSDGRGEAALAEFAIARELGERTPFRARAGLEIGHVHRRANRREEALDAYLGVAADPRSEPGAREEAELWAGRVHASQGRAAEAERLWERLSRLAEDPVLRIEAFDERTLAYVQAGDLEAAAGMLDRCRVALADEALEETQQGERVRSALLRMRAIPRLEQAIAARVGGVEIERKR